jgi:hypothetical protein
VLGGGAVSVCYKLDTSYRVELAVYMTGTACRPARTFCVCQMILVVMLLPGGGGVTLSCSPPPFLQVGTKENIIIVFLDINLDLF